MADLQTQTDRNTERGMRADITRAISYKYLRLPLFVAYLM
jgi:hypothetical protein